jgi:hypothetical protein
VLVVNEFSDVFFEELSFMPPECDIESVIELVYGTASMCKRPYRMIVKQLVELKDQIKELLEKGYIHSSSPLGEPPCDFHPEEGWYSTDVRVLSCSK